jgi:hypothetical protein
VKQLQPNLLAAPPRAIRLFLPFGPSRHKTGWNTCGTAVREGWADRGAPLQAARTQSAGRDGSTPLVALTTRATAVMNADRPRLGAVGKRRQQVGQLGTAMLRLQPLHAVPPAPPARLACEGELPASRPAGCKSGLERASPTGPTPAAGSVASRQAGLQSLRSLQRGRGFFCQPGRRRASV